MAHDGYHSTPQPYQTPNVNPNQNDAQGYPSNPPYPSAYYEQDRVNMPQSQMPPNPPSVSKMDPYADPPHKQSTGYLNDAVNSAVQNADSSAFLSPEVLSQITATVIQQLKASGLDTLQGTGSAAQSSRSQSQQPSYTAAELPPRPNSESPSTTSQRAASVPDPMANSYDSLHPHCAESGYSSDGRPRPSSYHDVSAHRHDSMSSQESQGQKTGTRPKPPSRDATLVEMTTLEKIWGKLFEDGKPTKRLGQFLRGIAVHLIEDYPPGNTIVIVPEKLQKFYADTSVSWDPYPWDDIFDDRTSSISRLFREVQAEHHLVQLDNLKERPDIPGLTPKGFEKWATLIIQAHPEREYERLQKAVLNMPISNPDDKKERFPKEIPRRLFPEVADIRLREDVDAHIMKHCGVDLPRITDEERAQAARTGRPSTSAPSSAEKPRPRSYERGRPPAAASSSSSAIIDDEDEPIPPAPIERERKPYTAQPGGGKKYDGPNDGPNHNRHSTGSFSTSRSSELPGSTSSHRPADKYDRDSLYVRSGSGPAQSRRYSRGSRSSSRSVNHDYRHSESDLLSREHTPRYGGVSAAELYADSPTPVLSDDERRFRDHLVHRGTRASDEDYYRGMLGGQGGGPVHDHKYKY